MRFHPKIIWVTLGVWGLSCWVPPPVVRDRQVNQPVILGSSIEPDLWDVIRPTAQNRQATFLIPLLQDEDVDDTIHYRWFIDYPFNNDIDIDGRIPASGDIDRFGIARDIDDLCAPNVFPAASPDGVHLIELVITDRDFAPQGIPVNRTVSPSATVLELSWTVSISGSTCAP